MSSNATGGSVSLTTSFSTVTSTLDQTTSTITSEFTTSSVIVTSIPPSTVIPETTPSSSIPPPETSSFIPITSTFTPPVTNPTQSPTVVVVTSTIPAPTSAEPTTSSSSSTSTTTSSSPSALSASGDNNGKSSGLGTGAKIAIAVVVPVVVIAALIIFGLWFWRKRKARKSNEELRKNEMAEYGFNPNNDPSLAAAGVVGGAAYAEDASDAPEDKSGYRGWGATSSGRKASTTLGSASRANGGVASDSGSQPGGYGSSPGTNPSDAYSSDPLMNASPEAGGHANGMAAGAIAGAAAAGVGTAGLARHRSANNGDIRRGTSNASSAYSNGPPRSEASSDVPGVPSHYYEQEVPYNIYNDPNHQGGPYGDGTYGGQNGRGNAGGMGQEPVIRDVQARRNTRIERAPTMPQTQGGISQNF